MEFWLGIAIAFVLAAVGYWVTVVFGLFALPGFTKRLRKLLGWLLHLHPSHTAAPYMELFGGRVELLTDKLLSRPAGADRRRQYYEVAPLDWDIIASHADVERDQESRALEEASRYLTRLHWVCLLGESGSGKSTLAWRVAAKLHENRVVVLRVMDKENPELWYKLAEFCESTKARVCVLADDLFRDSEVRRVLRDLSDSLPLTILATSQKSEYRPGPLKGELTEVTLGPPSLVEKEKVLRCLGRRIEDLNPDQLARFKAANSFLVLMIELTSGKGAQVVIRDLLENLQKRYEPVYRAYEYVCLPSSLGIAIPAVLLERLDSQGRFHNLPHREGAEGLIFSEDRNPDLLRAGHALLARFARDTYETRRSPSNVLRELIEAADKSSRGERVFLAHLMRGLASREQEMLRDSLPHVRPALDQCEGQADKVSELTIWRTFHLALGQADRAERCVDAALKLRPVDEGDCTLLLKLYRERGREADAFPIVERWIRDHPESDRARSAYLGLLERHGSAEEFPKAIEETGAWLDTNHDDSSVRTSYLRFVVRHGTMAQCRRVLREAGAWVARHPHDNRVRTAYLGSVTRKGTDDDVDHLLNETEAWLVAHPNDFAVRTAFLGLVERKGDPDRNERVLRETRAWLRLHPDATDVWTRFISLLVTFKRLDDAVALAEEAVSIHSGNINLVTQYLNLMEDKLSEDRTRDLYRDLMERFPKATAIKVAWASWLGRVGATEESEPLFKALLLQGPRDFSARHAYGRMLLAMGRYAEAAGQFRGVLKIRPDHSMGHEGLAVALQSMARGTDGPRSELIRGQAEREYELAIRCASKKNAGQAIFWNHLGCFYNEWKHWNDAVKAFDEAAREDPAYFPNFWGKGIALSGLRQWRDAKFAFETALRRAPVPLKPPASIEIPQLIATCEAELKLEESGVKALP